MKISEISNLTKGLGKEHTALLKLIDIKVDEEMRTVQAEIKSLHFKLVTLTWSILVIVLGFLAKLAFGV